MSGGEVIEFPGKGRAEHFLPVVLGQSGPKQCVRCGAVFITRTWAVTDRTDGAARLICPPCALADPARATWQRRCTASDAIDAALAGTADRSERAMVAHALRNDVEHFASWRWPDEPRVEFSAGGRPADEDGAG